MNHTIIVNLKEKGFGCNKTCEYCNWRFSSELPHGLQKFELISRFISRCNKSFITVSGGAEPLYKFEKYGNEIRGLLEFIKSHGYKTRLITREVQHIHKLKGLLDYVSISLDNEVLQEIRGIPKEQWKGIDVEYSLVLPPYPTQMIKNYLEFYKGLQISLGRRLVLRENLNSIFKVNFDELAVGTKKVQYVPRELCINSQYLTTKIVSGHDLILDRIYLFDYLSSNPYVYIFGGLLKHYIDPKQSYNDIDIIITDHFAIKQLEDLFGYYFDEVTSREFSYPKYFMGYSGKTHLPIQIVNLMEVDVQKFIFNNQYDIDHIYLHQGFLYADPNLIGFDIVEGIKNKQAKLIENRDMSLYHPSRRLIEMKHKQKLIKRGYQIHEG